MRKLDAEQKLEKLSQEEMPPVEVDTKAASIPKPDPVFAEHLTLQERFDKEQS